MPITFGDVLKANIVLLGVALLGEQRQRDKFIGAMSTEVDITPVIGGSLSPLSVIGAPIGGETGLTMHLRKDHIRIDSLPSRTLIEKEYPTLDDLNRLADIVSDAISLTDTENQALTAFGFNMDIVYLPEGGEPAAKYLAERLFPHQRSAVEGCVLTGGIGRLSYEGGDTKWNFIVEPRGNDPSGQRVFLSLNLHRDRQQLPDRVEILESLRETWNRLQDYANQLDREA